MWRWSCRKRDLGLVVAGVAPGLAVTLSRTRLRPCLPACSSRLPGPARRLSCIQVWSRLWCHLRSLAPEGGVGRRRGSSTLCAPRCGHPAAAVTNPPSQGSVPRVRRSPFLLWVVRLPVPWERWGRGAGEAEAGPPLVAVLAGRFPSPPLTPGLPRVAVTDRCGDLAFSRAGPKPCQTRDGHSWWVGPLFSFCLRAPCSSFPPVGGAGGCRGVRTPARPQPPVAAGLGSADAADTLAGLSWLLVVGDLLPVVGGAHPMPRCSPPGRAERVAPGPPWCPWSAPGRLRCLKPSGGAVPCSQRTPLRVAAVGGDARGGRVAESVKGSTPVPPAVGSGRLVVPAPQRPLLPGGCGGLTWWGELSDRGGPSRRRGAWPKPPSERGLSVSCPACCCRCFASVFLGPHPEARRSFRAATRATARVGKAGSPCCGP